MEEYPNILTDAHRTPKAMPSGSGPPLTKNDSIRIEVFIPPIRSKQGRIYKAVEMQEEL